MLLPGMTRLDGRQTHTVTHCWEEQGTWYQRWRVGRHYNDGIADGTAPWAAPVGVGPGNRPLASFEPLSGENARNRLNALMTNWVSHVSTALANAEPSANA